jgi:hypothetical protein
VFLAILAMDTSTSKINGGLDLLTCELWIVVKQVIDGMTMRDEFKDQLHADACASNAWLSKCNIWIDADI